jgi:hypothetical protein
LQLWFNTWEYSHGIFASNALRHILCHVVLYQKFVNAMGHH